MSSAASPVSESDVSKKMESKLAQEEASEVGGGKDYGFCPPPPSDFQRQLPRARPAPITWPHPGCFPTPVLGAAE